MRRITLAVVLVFLGVAANAATVKVDCGYRRIGPILASLNPLGPNTVHVFGTCRENIVIRGFDRLVLVARQGASLTDASGGQQAVLEVADSRRVEIRGFTIVGGPFGVKCHDGSLCRFAGNTVTGSTECGVWMRSSQATFQGDTIQDVGNAGLSFDASTVDAWDLIVQRNGHGIFVSNGSVFTGSGVLVRESLGDGIGVDTQSHLVLSNSTVSANGWVGVNLNNQSQALLGGQNNIAQNGIFGVGIGDMSQVYFAQETVTGNTIFDVGCYGRMSIASNLEGSIVGSTDCE